MELKDRILEAAYQLFSKKGYDKTSVADIINVVGASKGGFYHHFKSKEEILESISLSYVDNIKAYHQQVLADGDMPITDKFIESFYHVGELKKESLKQWPEIHRMYSFKGNHILLKKMSDAFQKETQDFYYHLIEQGNKQGIFHTKHPKQLAALWSREVIEFHLMSRKIFTGVIEEHDEFFTLLAFNEELINQQLGLNDTKIELIAFGKRYLAAMEEEFKQQVGSDSIDFESTDNGKTKAKEGR